MALLLARTRIIQKCNPFGKSRTKEFGRVVDSFFFPIRHSLLIFMDSPSSVLYNKDDSRPAVGKRKKLCTISFHAIVMILPVFLFIFTIDSFTMAIIGFVPFSLLKKNLPAEASQVSCWPKTSITF
jgi:hypothetical protein